MAESSFAVVSIIVGSGTVASVLYLGIGAVTVLHGVSERNIALAASIFRTVLWFLVDVDWSHSVWMVVMDVYMLVLMLIWVG